MQIHELPSASPSASDYIPIDNGTATRKTTLSSIDVGSNQVTFTSGDTSSPSSWQTVAVMASNTAANLMNAISKMVANIRWLYNRLGTSSTGTTATTVTGAIAEHSTKIGNADMGTTATTLTGAIAEVNDSVNTNTDDIATLNSNLNDLNNQFKTITVTATTSGSGNISYGFGKKVYVLAAWTTRADTFVCPFPVSGTDESGASTWWLNVRSATSAGAAVASTSVTVSALYIEA